MIFGLFKRRKDAVAGVVAAAVDYFVTRYSLRSEVRFEAGRAVIEHAIVKRDDAPEAPDLDGDGLPG